MPGCVYESGSCAIQPEGFVPPQGRSCRAVDGKDTRIHFAGWKQAFLGAHVGSPAWIRTTIHGSKGRCPTIRRPGI